ncbi:hypothetical protein AC70_4811 [Escherichia coli 2-210-07_S4_C1]|nr:hypothetical protein AC70_4811 [Escherichia coli 2-210-07_S4_C1]
MSQGISNPCFFSVVQVTDTDARIFFYDFLRFFQNIQLHLPVAYFLIQSGDFLPHASSSASREGSLCLRIVW